MRTNQTLLVSEVADDSPELLGVALHELRRLRIEANRFLDNMGQDNRRQDGPHQGQTNTDRVKVCRHLSFLLPAPQIRDILRPERNGGRCARRGGAFDCAPDEEPGQVRLGLRRPKILGDQDIEGKIRACDGRFGFQPALMERVIEALLPAEVIGNELLIDPCPRGDVLHAGASKPLRRKLLARGLEQQFARPLRIAMPLLRRGSAPTPPVAGRSIVLRCSIVFAFVSGGSWSMLIDQLFYHSSIWLTQ